MTDSRSILLPTRTLAIAFALAPPSAALADTPDHEPPSILCDGRFRTQVTIDGLQRDWEAEAQPAERAQHLIAGEAAYDWTGPADASFRLWCRSTEHGLYFAVVGRDDRVLGPEERSEGDRFQLLFDLSAGLAEPRVASFTFPLAVDPVDGRVLPVRRLDGQTSEPSGAVAEVAPRDTGFFAEVYLPFTALPGLGRPLGPIPFAAIQRDIDRDARREEEVAIATAPDLDPERPATWGRLAFTAADDRVARMRESIPRGTDAPPTGPVWGRVEGAHGPALALVVADHLLLSGEGFPDFTWIGLPVLDSADETVLDLHFRDVDADGWDEIVLRTRRRRPLAHDGDAPSPHDAIEQDLLRVFRRESASLVPLLQQEVALRRPGLWAIEARIVWTERRGARLRVDEVTAEGVDRDSFLPFHDPSVHGARPTWEELPLPWRTARRVTWTLDGARLRATRD